MNWRKNFTVKVVFELKHGQEITVDFVLKSGTILTSKQNDINSRYIIASITNNGESIVIPNGAKATLNIRRSDNAKKCYLTTIENNKVKGFLSSWAVELEGQLLCDISIIDNEEKLTTTSFAIRVEEACCTSEDIEDATSEDIITNILSELTEIENTIGEWQKQITSDSITIQNEEWVYNASTNKYEYTVNNNDVTPQTYIIANDYEGLLLEGDVISNDNSYTITAPVKPTGAVTLLLIFLKGGGINERTI